MVVGLDDQGCSATYILASLDRYGTRWSPTDLPGFVPLLCDVRLLGQGRVGGKHPNTIDPELMLELQQVNPPLNDGDFCCNGGFAQRTTDIRENGRRG